MHQLKHTHVARVTRRVCTLYVILHKQSPSACFLNKSNNGKQREKRLSGWVGDVMSEWVDAVQ